MGKIAKFSTAQSAFNFGAWPGYKSKDKGDLKPRLSVKLQIVITDGDTGEKVSRNAPLETNDADSVVPWLSGVLEHERLLGDIESFVRGRNG